MAATTPIFSHCEDCPLLIVISGPSGVGKDAVVKRLKDRNLPFHFVVTATSRPKRENEIHGEDYFFVEKEEFEKMISDDELIEHAVVYDQYKGIPKQQVRQALASGKDVVMRLDVQGAAKVHQLCEGAVLIFLTPDNDQEWLARLRDRKTETAEDLRIRLDTARAEKERMKEFDYVVTNAHDRLDDACDAIIAIVKAEHHRVNHRKITL